MTFHVLLSPVSKSHKKSVQEAPSRELQAQSIVIDIAYSDKETDVTTEVQKQGVRITVEPKEPPSFGDQSLTKSHEIAMGAEQKSKKYPFTLPFILSLFFSLVILPFRTGYLY